MFELSEFARACVHYSREVVRHATSSVFTVLTGPKSSALSTIKTSLEASFFFANCSDFRHCGRARYDGPGRGLFLSWIFQVQRLSHIQPALVTMIRPWRAALSLRASPCSCGSGALPKAKLPGNLAAGAILAIGAIVQSVGRSFSGTWWVGIQALINGSS